MKRLCAVCAAQLSPFTEETLTAHEFNCYQVSGKVPEYHRKQFEDAVKWKRRSDAAKKGAATRRANKR